MLTTLISGKSYGVHMNGYVYKDGQLMMWVGVRNPNKAKYPGCYDNIVAGGIRLLIFTVINIYYN